METLPGSCKRMHLPRLSQSTSTRISHTAVLVAIESKITRHPADSSCTLERRGTTAPNHGKGQVQLVGNGSPSLVTNCLYSLYRDKPVTQLNSPY